MQFDVPCGALPPRAGTDYQAPAVGSPSVRVDRGIQRSVPWHWYGRPGIQRKARHLARLPGIRWTS